MSKKESSRKPLIIGIIAAVVILAVLLILLLTQCMGGEPEATNDPTATTGTEVPTYELYWNADRAEYDGKSEAGMSSRMPESDGFFHVRFILDGEEVILKVQDRKLINAIDVQDVMGLTFDENGVVNGVLELDDMPLEKLGWQFYVQSAAKKLIKLNSSESMNGMEVLLELNENTGVYDMTGLSGPVGVVCDPINMDRVYAVANLAGEVTHVFIYQRPNYMLTHEAECQHCKKTVTWYEWTKTDAMPLTTGHYQLMNDIQLTGQPAQQEDAKVCIDLNGKRVDGKSGSRCYAMFNTGAELAIMDTSEGQTGVMAAHGKGDQGMVVWVRYGQFYLYGGTLDASDATSKLNGVAVECGKGKYFYMHGGTIIGGKAEPQQNDKGQWNAGMGGALAIGGKFVMNAGEIRGGNAGAVITKYNADGTPNTYQRGFGGNIFLYSGAVMEMNGGTIKNGKAGNVGGNIYMDGTAELTINDGIIYGGTLNGNGRNGGNIFAGSKAVITQNGGSVLAGSVRNCGGNVYLNGKYTMNGGVIADGVVRDFKTGKVQPNAASANVFVVNGIFHMYGGKVAGHFQAIDTSATDTRDTTVLLSGYATIDGGEKCTTNLNLSSGGGGITVYVGNMLKGSRVGVTATTGIFTEPTKESNKPHFFSDIEGAEILYWDGCLALGRVKCICGKSTDKVTSDEHINGCDGELHLWAPWTSSSSLPTTTGKYYLLKDVTTTNQTTMGNSTHHDVMLDTNGKNVTLKVGSGSWDGFRLYRVDNGSNLLITDTTDKPGTFKTIMPKEGTKFTGRIVKETKEDEDGNTVNIYYEGEELQAKAEQLWRDGNFGMLLWARGGNITIHNGIFDGSNLSSNKTGMVASIGNNTVTDAETGEKTPYYGSLTMYGGKIIGGTVRGNGGITVNGKATLNLHGGEITGGRVDLAGVEVDNGQGGNIFLEGTMNMTGGKVTDGYCHGGAKGGGHGGNIAVSGGLLNVTGGEITGGWASSAGGNIGSISSGSRIVLSNAKVTDGEAYQGGNISCYVRTSKLLEVKDGTVVSGGTAKQGGNVYLGFFQGNSQDMEAIFDNAIIRDGVAIQGGTDTGFGGNIYIRNTTGDRYNADTGKLIATKSAINVTFNNTKVEDGEGIRGGNIWMERANVTMNETTVSGGLALHPDYGQGGNIFIGGASNIALNEGTVITGGKADSTGNKWCAGGNIYMNNGNMTVDGAVIKDGDARSDGNNIYINGSSVVTLESGSFEGGIGKNENVYMQGGKLIMNGGKLTTVNGEQNLYTNMDGGIADITINGGEIIGAEFAGNGANIYLSGKTKFVMNGGLIKGGNSTNGQGGNIVMTSGTKNETYYSATFEMNGGVIEGGKSKYNGGNVCVLNNSVFTMNDGVIRGGHCDDSGGNMYVNGYLNMHGGVMENATAKSTSAYNLFLVNGDMVMTGGEVKGGMGMTNTDSAKVACSLKLSGTPVISKGETGYGLSMGTTASHIPQVEIVEDLKKGASIHVNNTGYISHITDEKNVKYFHPVSDELVALYDQQRVFIGQSYCLCGGKDAAWCDHEKLAWAPYSTNTIALNGVHPGVNLFAPGNYYLTESKSKGQQNINANIGGYTVNFDLRGFKWEASGTRTFLLQNNNVLGITDTVGGGSLVGKGHTVNAGNILMQGSSTLNLYAGTITQTQDAVVSPYAGNVELSGSTTMNVYGGVVENGIAKEGGNIYVSDNATLNVYEGAVIRGGRASQGGNIWAKGKVNIENATVSNGVAFNKNSVSVGYTYGQGGNIFASGAKAIITIEGKDTLIEGGQCETTDWAPGGNIFATSGANVHIEDATVKGGKGGDGHNLYISSDSTVATLKNATFINTSTGSSNIRVERGTVNIEGSTITNEASGAANLSCNESYDDKGNEKIGHYIVKSSTVSGGYPNVKLEGLDTFEMTDTVLDGKNVGQNVSITAGSTFTMHSGTIQNASGSNVYLTGSAEFVMHSGTITGGKGNISVNSSSLFTMNNGTVEKGTATYGPNLSMSNAKFIMNGGTIQDGVATSDGGNVCMSGTAELIMNGGEIKNGQSGGYGGNIVVWDDSKVTVNKGATISGGDTAAQGGNVYVTGTSGTLTVAGGTISGGYAKGNGGNVGVNGKATLVLTSGEISGGESKDSGGNVVVYGTFNMSGGTVKDGISGNPGNGMNISIIATSADTAAQHHEMNLSGGTIAGGVHFNNYQGNTAIFNVSGNPVVDKELTSISTKPTYSVKLDINNLNVGTLTDGAKIMVCGAERIFTTPAPAGADKYFKAETANMNVWQLEDMRLVHGRYSCICGANSDNPADHIGECDGTKHNWLPINYIPETTGYYYLTSGVTDTVANNDQRILKPGTVQNIYLDLNGQTVNSNRWRMYRLDSTVNLTLTDNGNGNGTIKVTGTKEQGSVVWFFGGDSTFSMYGGTIDASTFQNKDTLSAAGHQLGGSAGTFKLFRGTVKGGKINGNINVGGTAISFENGKDHILGNMDVTSQGGTAIYVGTGTKVNMSHTTQKPATPWTVSAAGTFTKNWNDDWKISDYFVLDPAIDGEIKLENGELTVGKYHCLCGQEDHVGECNGKDLYWLPWRTHNSLPTGTGNWYLSWDISGIGQQGIGGSNDVKLDLNGHNITANVGARVYLTMSTSKLAITDCKGTGVIYGGGHSANGGVILANDTSTWSLYSGTVTLRDDAVVCSTGTITQVAYVFNMYGGKILVNKNGGSAIVINDNKTMTMTGGHILNTATREGNAIGTTVSLWTGATLNMQGGTIETTGKYCRNISADGKLIMTGGTIKGGHLAGDNNGANIQLKAASKGSHISGGIIEGGVAEGASNGWGGQGGNIAVTGELKISGDAVIRDGYSKTNAGYNIVVLSNSDTVQPKVEITGGTIAGGIYFNNNKMSPAFTLSGTPVIDKELTTIAQKPTDSLRLSNNDLTIGTLTDGAKIMVSGEEGIFSYAAPAGADKYFHSEVTGLAVWQIEGQLVLVYGRNSCVCGSNSDNPADHIGECDGTKHNWLPVTELPATSGYYYLIADVTDSGDQRQIKTAEDIYLDLNGKTVTSKRFRMYWLQSTSSLTITDNGNGKGTIYIDRTSNDQGAIAWPGGSNTFAMYGGTIDATKTGMASNKILAGLVTAGSGTQKLFRGTIKGGSAPGTNLGGAAIALEGGKTHILGDMEITSVEGAAIFVSNYSTIDMSKAQKPDTPWTIQASGVFTKGWNENWNISDYFVADPKYGCSIELDEATGELRMGKYYCICGQTPHIGECKGDKLFWQPWFGGDTLPNGGNFFLVRDVARSGQTVFNKDTALDLNGYNYTFTVPNYNDGFRMLRSDAGAKVSITDCSGKATPGTMKLVYPDLSKSDYDANREAITKGNEGMLIWVRQAGGSFHLYNGIFDGSAIMATERDGATISVDGGTSLNIYGGTVKPGNIGWSHNIRVSGTMTMTGGVIEGGKANNGGNISVFGTLYLKGGEIRGGSVTGSAQNILVKPGGKVYMSGGKVISTVTDPNNALRSNIAVEVSDTNRGYFEISGGTVENTAKNVRNFSLSGDMTISGGTIKGGNITAAENGANIGAWPGSTIIMEGGSILGGNTANQGGNIALYGTMEMSGGTIKDGRSGTDEGHNIAMIHTGGTCTLDMSGGTIAGGIYMNNHAGDATVKLSGSPVIDKSLTSDDAAAKPTDSLRISAAKGTTNNTLLDVKGLTGGTVYVKGYTAGQFAINAASGMEAFVKSETYEGETLLPVCYDNGGLYFGKVYCLCGASETGGTHSQGCLAENGGKELVWVPADSHDDFQTSGNYYLTKDITNKDITTVSNTNVVIDLNGHSITRNDGWRSFSYYKKENTTLTVTNTGSTGKMSSTGSSTNQGTLFWLTGTNNTLKLIQGEFDASGFTLSASSGGRTGAAICAEGTSPAITMYEGVTLKSGKVIQGGTTNDAYGGGISITGKLDVLGGTIQGGQASRGGNILGRGNSTITLSGNAKVIDGQVNGESGVSVYALGGNIYAGGKLYIKDNAQVTGGKAGMTVAGGWTAGGNIYSGSTLEITGNGRVTGGQSASQGGNIYGNGSARITLSDNAEVSGGSGSRGGNFYMDQGTQVTMTGGSVKNGTTTEDGGLFTLIGASKLTISGGTVTGGSATNKGGILYTEASGSNVPTVNISNITITEGTANNGGMLRVTCGTITLTNATLSGGVASYGGNVFVSGGTVTLNNSKLMNGHANNTTGYGQGGNLYTSGGTFTLDADSTISGGHTTNGNGDTWKPGANGYLNGGTVNIKGTVTGGYGASQGHNFYINAGSTLNVDGGLVHNTTDGAHNIYIKGGKLNVRNNGRVICEAKNSHNIYSNAEVFEDGKTPTITIDSGSVSNEKTTGTSHNIYLSATATLNLNGGIVSNGQANQSTNVYLAGKATKDDVTRHSTVNMTGGTITNSWTDGYTGRNVTLAANTEFNMTGGEISNARMKNNPGANILVNNGATFTLKGGTISGGIADYLDNTNDTGYGGNIRIEAGGIFNMIGGKVTGGKLLKNTSGGGLGGNFFVSGTLNITGGTVEKGEAVTGGNIGTNDKNATVKISGATIQDGIAKSGGNVYLNVRSCKEFTIGEGTKILNGKATEGSAGNLGINIFLDNGSKPVTTMTISGATITGGTATVEGGNVYIAGVSGDKASVRIENTTISGGTATTTGGLCASDGDVILGLDGKIVIDGNNGNNLWLANNATILVEDLTNGSRIGIAAASDRYVTDEVSAEEAAYFVADDPNKNTYFDANKVYLGQMHCICGKPDGTCTTYTDAAGNTVGCDGKVIKWTAWTSDTTLPTATGNYYLTKDVTVATNTALSANVVLDLNGYTVTVTGQRMYTPNSGATLTVTNTVKDKGGIVVDGNVWGGGLVETAETGETVNLYGVKISMTDTSSTTYGGGFFAMKASSTLNIFGDTVIEGGRTGAGSNAGNVMLKAGSTVNMFDGIIRNGVATPNNGGGVGDNIQCSGTLNMYGDALITNTLNEDAANVQLVSNTATLNMYGGKITGDVVTWHSAGAKAPVINLSGAAQITKGTNCGLKLASTSVIINITGELTGAEPIAITCANALPYAFAQGSGYTLDYASKYWFKPTGDQQIGFFEDGKLYLVDKNAHMHCECGGLLEGEEGHTCVDIIYQAMTKSNTSLYNKNSDLFAANYYLADDLVMNGGISIRHNADVKICLNGHTLSLPDGTNSRTISMFCDGTDKSYCVHKDVDTFLGTPKLALSDCDDGRDGKVLSTRAKADVGNVIWARYGEVTIYGATLEATGNTEGSNIGLVLGATTGKITTYDVTLIGGVAGQDEYTGKGSTLSVDSKGTLILKGSLTIENSGGLDVYQKEGGTIDVTNLESVNKTLRISAAGPFAKGYGANTSANKSSFFKLWDENLDVDLYEVDGTLCAGHYRCYCGATDGNHTEGCIELSGVATAAEVEPFHWLPYRASTSSIPTSGDYYLIRPISNLAANAVASGATLKLDLNGMDITGKDGQRAFSFLNRADSTMIFTDTSSMKLEEQGTVKVTNTVGSTNQGPLFWFAHTGTTPVKNNTLYILAGTFDASGYTIASNGGAILFSDASANNAVHMYGGKMLGGELKDYETVTSRSGGTVYLDGTDNSFTLHGGQIVGGKAYKGGVVYLRGTTTFTLKDGTMTGSSGVYQGGAVYVDSANAKFIMDDGNITGGNTTNKGGNVGVVNGTFTLNGGEISGGNGGDNGGNIWVASTGTLEMNGGKISGGKRSNSETVASANMFMVGAARFYMKGGEITGYVQSYNNSTAAKPTIEISGDAKIYNGTNTNNLLIDNTDTGLLTVVKFGTLTEGAKVGISYGVNFENGHVGATGVSASNNNYIVWDETNWNYIIDTGAQTAALKTKVSN